LIRRLGWKIGGLKKQPLEQYKKIVIRREKDDAEDVVVHFEMHNNEESWKIDRLCSWALWLLSSVAEFLTPSPTLRHLQASEDREIQSVGPGIDTLLHLSFKR
jgi:hypothetical protein